MTNKKLQELIKEAKAALKDYPDIDVDALITGGEVWLTLTPKQQDLVRQALMPRSVIG